MANQQRRMNILLIESSARRLGLVQTALNEAGTRCRLHTVGTGGDSLKYLKREAPFADAPRPDLVIVDLTHPRERLVAFVDKLKSIEEFEQLPLIVVTRPATEAMLAEKYPESDDCVMFSPIEFSTFLKTMNSLPGERFLKAVRFMAGLGFVLVRAPDSFDEESSATQMKQSA